MKGRSRAMPGFTVVIADPNGERELVITAVLQPGTPGSARLWTVVDTVASLDGRILTNRTTRDSDGSFLARLAVVIADWVLGVEAESLSPRAAAQAFRQAMRRATDHYHLGVNWVPLVEFFRRQMRIHAQIHVR